MDREFLNSLKSESDEPKDEADHFYLCPKCGQAVDARKLGDVLWHEREFHEPLSTI
jgi:hypothetical protein